MILCDVNVLVNAAVAASPHHSVCLAALKTGIADGAVFGNNATICAGMVRIATHVRVFDPPMTTAEAFAFLAYLDLVGRTEPVEPGARHWPLFQGLVDEYCLSGAEVMDAWFAALAIEHEAEWWSCDAGFAKYPGLRFRNLLG